MLKNDRNDLIVAALNDTLNNTKGRQQVRNCRTCFFCFDAEHETCHSTDSPQKLELLPPRSVMWTEASIDLRGFRQMVLTMGDCESV